MADLKDRFTEWRREVAEALGGSAETLEELEGHLRDEVSRRIATGETPDAAFTAAAAHLGRPEALATEFARVTPSAPWLPVRLAVIVLIAGAGWLGGALLPRPDGLLSAHVVAVTLGYSITLLIGALAACYVLARPFGAPSLPHVQGLLRAMQYLTLAALVLAGVGVVLGGVWAQEHLGRFWGWDAKETAALIVLLWDATFCITVNKRLFGDHVLILLGFGGSALVAMAWLGPAVLGLGLHSYGMASLTVPLVVFVLAQAALACLGLIPAGALSRWVRQS
jgi:ABC-type transport system involved in cytochrome c biogenesis permease subunit